LVLKIIGRNQFLFSDRFSRMLRQIKNVRGHSYNVNIGLPVSVRIYVTVCLQYEEKVLLASLQQDEHASTVYALKTKLRKLSREV